MTRALRKELDPTTGQLTTHYLDNQGVATGSFTPFSQDTLNRMPSTNERPPLISQIGNLLRSLTSIPDSWS